MNASVLFRSTQVKEEAQMIEKCRSCGFEHEDLSGVVFRRNHVSNRTLPYCRRCLRRLYQVPYRPDRDLS